jgi:chaperonin GroES
MAKFSPLHDRILVRRVEEASTTRGGIIIPDSAKDKPQEGEVISTGKGRTNDEGKTFPLAVKEGDRVLFGKVFRNRNQDRWRRLHHHEGRRSPRHPDRRRYPGQERTRRKQEIAFSRQLSVFSQSKERTAQEKASSRA